MKREELLPLIGNLVNQKRRDLGFESVTVGPETEFLDGNLDIDSLDLAAIVVELQEATGQDPFANGFVEFRTVGELAELFAA